MKKKIVGIIIALVIFFFLGRHIYLNWQKINQYQWSFNIWFLLISFIVFLFRYSIGVGIWRLILKKVGFNLGYGKSFRIWFISLMGKYIPGKVWASVGKIYLAEKEEVPNRVTFSSLVYGYCLSGIATFMFGIFFPLAYGYQNKIFNYSAFFCSIPVILLILHPVIFEKLVNLVLKKLNKGTVTINMSYPQMFKFIGMYLGNWMVMSIAFYYFVNSIYSIDLTVFPVMAGAFALSMLAGFVGFFTPAGLGIREGVMTGLLSIFLPVEVAIVIAVGSRIWTTLGELIGLGTVMIFIGKDYVTNNNR